jgi:hypothetical protein
LSDYDLPGLGMLQDIIKTGIVSTKENNSVRVCYNNWDKQHAVSLPKCLRFVEINILLLLLLLL